MNMENSMWITFFERKSGRRTGMQIWMSKYIKSIFSLIAQDYQSFPFSAVQASTYDTFLN